MSKPRKIVVQTLQQFSSEVEQALEASRKRNRGEGGGNNWYRGHGLASSHKLHPALYRHPGGLAIKELLELEGVSWLGSDQRNALTEREKTSN